MSPQSDDNDSPARLAYWALLLGLPLLAGLIIPSAVRAQTNLIDREYEIKAAYLYNFAKYVEWPESADRAAGIPATLVIGVVGENPFGSALDEVARRQVEDRQIVVRYFRSMDEYRPCHILFVSRNTPDTLARAALEAAQQTPTLLVGERDGFAHRGGMINLYIEQNRVRFEINERAAAQAGIRISSKLLSIGRIVEN